MEKETVEKKLKYETEFLKIYTVFVLAISTGDAGLILRGNLETSRWERMLFIIGMFFCLYLQWHSYILLSEL